MFRLTCEKRLMMILVSNRYDVLPLFLDTGTDRRYPNTEALSGAVATHHGHERQDGIVDGRNFRPEDDRC